MINIGDNTQKDNLSHYADGADLKAVVDTSIGNLPLKNNDLLPVDNNFRSRLSSARNSVIFFKSGDLVLFLETSKTNKDDLVSFFTLGFFFFQVNCRQTNKLNIMITLVNLLLDPNSYFHMQNLTYESIMNAFKLFNRQAKLEIQDSLVVKTFIQSFFQEN